MCVWETAPAPLAARLCRRGACQGGGLSNCAAALALLLPWRLQTSCPPTPRCWPRRSCLLRSGVLTSAPHRQVLHVPCLKGVATCSLCWRRRGRSSPIPRGCARQSTFVHQSTPALLAWRPPPGCLLLQVAVLQADTQAKLAEAVQKLVAGLKVGGRVGGQMRGCPTSMGVLLPAGA